MQSGQHRVPIKPFFGTMQSLCWMDKTCILDVFFIILALRSQLQQYSVCYCCDYCKIYFCFNPSMYFLLDDCISYTSMSFQIIILLRDHIFVYSSTHHFSVYQSFLAPLHLNPSKPYIR